MNYLLPERLDRLAREHALGTLSPRARRRFDRVLQQSPAAMLAVGVWQRRLAQLSTHMPPMQPRESVWRALEQRLFAGAPAPAAPPSRSSAWSWLGALLSGRSLGGALAGVLLCVLVLRLQPGLADLEPQRDGLPPSYVGLLLDGAGKPAVLASSRRHGRQLTVKLLQPLAVPAGQVAQLWALPADGSPPFPVGVVPATGPATLALTDSSEKLFFKVSQLAVSVEPAAAKPGDTPSGAFVLQGHCVKLW
ncbi:anti-sigma factor [uncultured Methylibium sp.]|uniref:anti-sigma factor n=1 Tax=uncultured Methylibium sp. TaxID=381093 RepID=UPI0025CEC717|nr:anti-sigma factor [uncultured Methylibium sp.]